MAEMTSFGLPRPYADFDESIFGVGLGRSDFGFSPKPPNAKKTTRRQVVLLVARAGIEPATFRFSGGRSYQLSYLAGRHRLLQTELPRRDGDPDGTRTRDLRRDRAAR